MGADAIPARLAGLDPACELRLLRLVGLALRLPARRLDARQPRAGRRDPSRDDDRRAQDVADARTRVRPRAARLLQVRELLPQLRGQPVRAVVDRARRPARRDLLLHVHGDLVRRRHLPRHPRARLPRPLRGLPGVLPAPRGRPDRPRERAAAPARAAPRPAAGRHLPRVHADRRRPVPEGRDRQPPRDAHRRRRIRGAEPALVARGARRRSTAMPFRSSPTSAATRTSRSASRSCSGSSSRRTSTRRTPRSRCRTSGGAGT